MRIALIGCTVNPRVGGMGRALYDHAMALAEAGQEVVVYTLDTPHPIRGLRLLGPSGTPLPQGERGFDWHTGRIKSLLHIGKAAWGARFDPPLDVYDVVHLHLPFFGVAEKVALEMLKRACPGQGSGVQHDKKLFVTYHMDAIGTGLKRIYFNWWYRHRFKKVLDACDAIAVTSHPYARDSWLAKAGVDVEKCEEILLRVDTGKFFPHPIRGLRSLGPRGAPLPEGEGKYLLFVGAMDRAHYFKGLSLLLRAIMHLPDARLVVVGAGELLGEYKKEAAQLGIADRVTFTGGISDDELARWYARARALVLPSTDRSEAFGIVLIEAMACGTPVIASDLPGVREVVERVRGGVLVPFGIVSSPVAPRNDSLSAAIQKMWQRPWSDDDRAALAERATATYSRTTLAEQLMKWYNQTHVPSR